MIAIRICPTYDVTNESAVQLGNEMVVSRANREQQDHDHPTSWHMHSSDSKPYCKSARHYSLPISGKKKMALLKQQKNYSKLHNTKEQKFYIRIALYATLCDCHIILSL